MKTLTTFASILLFSVACLAQSKSFVSLKEKFSGDKDVYSLQASGFLARVILRMAGEHEFYDAVKDVRNVRLIVIPQDAFRRKSVTLSGFKKFTKKDSFQELAHVRDHGDRVTLLMQSSVSKRDNRYLVLIDNNNEVIAIEVKGYIDPTLMLKEKRDLAYDQ